MTLRPLAGAAATALALLLCAAAAQADVLTVRVPLGAVRQHPTPAGVRLEVDGFPLVALPERPALPLRTLLVALPPDAAPDSVTVTARPQGVAREALAGPLGVGGPRLWLTPAGARLDRSPWGPGVAGPRTAWQAELERGRTDFAAAVSVGTLRRWPVVSVAVSPVRLDVARGALETAAALDLDVSFRRGTRRAPPVAADAAFARLLRGAVANPEDVTVPDEDEGAAPTLIIAVEEALRARLTRLDDYIAHREAQGFRVVVVTDAETNPGPFLGPSAGMLRAWLQRHWEELGATHLLLLADPRPSRVTGLPMAVAHAAPVDGLEPEGIPTDAFFADLTGDWDRDGDGRLAEWPDDFRTGGVDLLPELFVGRIPVNRLAPAEADEALARAMAHDGDRADGRWRRRILTPAAVLFYAGEGEGVDLRQSGAEVTQWLAAGPAADRGFPLHRLYEWDGVEPETYESEGPLSEWDTIAGFQEGFGLVFWLGHGNGTTVARRIWTGDANGDGLAQLDEVSFPDFLTSPLARDELGQLARGPFVFMGACSNAQPEVDENLAATVLRAGAAGTVGATRITTGYGGPGWAPDDGGGSCCFTFGERYLEGLMDGRPAGEALAAARLRLGSWAGELAVRNKLEHNLYGDPLLGLHQCAVAADCDDGRFCTGESRCEDGFCVAGDPPACDAAADGVAVAACQVYACDDAARGCALAPAPAGAPCDDGRFCTTADACREDGACTGAPTCAGAVGVCAVPQCLEDEDRCTAAPAPDGAGCRTPEGAAGTCGGGTCLAPRPAGPDAGDDGGARDPAPDAAGAAADTVGTTTSGAGGCAAGGGATSAGALTVALLLAIALLAIALLVALARRPGRARRSVPG
jgi:hypothetical protein